MLSDSLPAGVTAETLAKLRHHQHVVHDFSRLLASYIPLDQLLPLTALRLARGLGVDHSMILRYDASQGDLLLAAGLGWGPGMVGAARFPIEAASPAGRTQQTRMTTCVQDLLDTTEFRPAALLRERGIRSLINAPVVSGGVVWGVLEMHSTQPGRFDADDERFLLSMANLLGVAIERAADQDAATDARSRASEAQQVQTLRLSELQHRTKNNLAVIASMLLLEQSQHSDAHVKERLRGLMDRVTAIGLAHEQLDALPDGAVVALAPYITQLSRHIALQHDGIRIEMDLQAVAVPLDQAVPLGLIVNELITNAAKYAFPEGSGTVRITLSRDAETGEATLAVTDDGVGLGPLRPGSLGTRLIKGLAAQISGMVLRPAVERGTRVEVLFPAPLP